MKEFDIELAKAGAPLCTRKGNKARIVCYDMKGKYPLVALIEQPDEDEEHCVPLFENGKVLIFADTSLDLFINE